MDVEVYRRNAALTLCGCDARGLLRPTDETAAASRSCELVLSDGHLLISGHGFMHVPPYLFGNINVNSCVLVQLYLLHTCFKFDLK